MVNARNIRLTVTSCSGRCRSRISSPPRMVPGATTDRYAPGRASAVNVFSQPFSPTQPRKVEHGIRADVTCSTTSSPICHRSPIRASLTSRSTVVRFSPKNPFGDLPAEPLGPSVQILALEGVHGLTVAAVVRDVADEVAHHTAAQTAVLGSGSPELHRTAAGAACRYRWPWSPCTGWAVDDPR